MTEEQKEQLEAEAAQMALKRSRGGVWRRARRSTGRRNAGPWQ